MLSELDNLYQSIERRKTEILTRLDALPDADRRKNPAPTEWSPLQVMEHVILVEELVVGPDALTLPANAQIQLKGRLFVLVGGAMMRSGLRMPTLPIV